MAIAERVGRWSPDVLGEHFEQLTLPLGSDDEGEVVATLVRHRPPFRLRLGRGAASGCDVLYVHGWSDYFFNPELAEFFSNAGARFFALDLCKYGRSLRPGQTLGYITDLAAYDVDIDAALAAMGHSAVSDAAGAGRSTNAAGRSRSTDAAGAGRSADAADASRSTDAAGGPRSSDAAGRSRSAGGASARPLVLVGHSTGGLTLSLWAARHPGRASSLILNSPWLEFQMSRIGREALAPVMAWGARVNPMGPMPNVDLGFYSRSIAKELDGEWTYSHDWRPDRGFATHPAWLTAILAGHATVAAGIDVGAPVLTLLSARSTMLTRWDAAMLASDIVLVVDDIAERTLRLAPQVSIARINGALHDVFLSRAPARAAAYAAVTRWLRGYAPARR